MGSSFLNEMSCFHIFHQKSVCYSQRFTADLQIFCIAISAISVTVCNSGPISDQRKGPTAERKIAEEHFVIVGAGVAGLTSALLLLQAGHRWEF